MASNQFRSMRLFVFELQLKAPESSLQPKAVDMRKYEFPIIDLQATGERIALLMQTEHHNSHP